MSAAENTDTIVAISTPAGRGGIGVVRLAGGEALRIAGAMLRLRHPLEPQRARFAEVVNTDDGSKLDDAVVTWFAAGRSYTGDDIVEIAAHGAPVVLEAMVRQAMALGARLAEPGEFTRRAFLNGRLDLTQAEAVHDLIAAQTMHQARVAAEQMDGALARNVAPVKESLLELIAALEAGIDFAEDDVDVMPVEVVRAKIVEVRERAAKMADSFTYGRLVRDGVTLALFGRPNVGKSSLFNQLVQRERAIVTAEPGTTRDLVNERISLDGIPVELVDTAGIRVAGNEAEAMGIQKTREAVADAEIVLLVLDASSELEDEDKRLLEMVRERGGLIAWNKCDLLHGEHVPEEMQAEVVRTSAKTGVGIDELRARIAKRIHGGVENELGLITNLRQQQSLVDCVAAMDAATAALGAKVPHEMLLLDIYSGLRGLDALTGATTADDVLDRIFSTFCIGK